MAHPALEAAEQIAEDLLFPAAMAVDAADLVPRSHFEALAGAGLYGLSAPEAQGGLDGPALWGVIERLASGCLSTAFVWLQHHTPVRELAATSNAVLRDALMPVVCSGHMPAGIALGGLQGGAAGLKAHETPGGWLIDGTAPYVTGWGIIEVLLLAAMTPDGRVLRCFIDTRESDSMQPERLQLLAANASGTVRLHFSGHFVPDNRVASLTPYTPPPTHDGGGRPNGSLALGVTRRCLSLMGPGPLDQALLDCRSQLDSALDEGMAEARASAAALAVRAASRLIVSEGSRSITTGAHAQRLYREAAFLLVFGSRTATRTALLEKLA